MNLSNTLGHIQRGMTRNSPTILTALGVSGVIVTAYLTGKAAYRAGYDDGVHAEVKDPAPNRREAARQHVTRHWRLYAPAAVSATVAIGCVVGAQRASNRRMAAAQAVLVATDRAFAEYRDKFAEHYGAKKEQSLRDEIAQDRVNRNPPPSNMVVSGIGQVMCREDYTGRYFTCDMETLRRAQNDINAKLLGGATTYVTLSDLYDKIGLPYTSTSSDVGWEIPKQLDIQYSTTLTPQGVPCLVINYNYIKNL